MHAKYFVIVEERPYDRNYRERYMVPTAYWMGSKNFTENSQYNQEVATFVKNEQLATNLFNDFVNTFLVAENLRK